MGYASLTRDGILRERLADTLTDALRAAILRQVGYRVEVVEFVDSVHTPRNTLLRAVRTGSAPSSAGPEEYDALVSTWHLQPQLAELLDEAAACETGAMKLTVVQGDITTQDVDAVVNAANRGMRGGGGVDGAIHRAGGPAVLEDCRSRFPDGLGTGQAGWTTAGNMPARWVIHVVGPNYNAGERDRSLLTSCYANALGVADELGASTVAFPLVSAGVYGWPKEDAVAAAVETLSSTPTQVEEARLVAFDRAAYDLLSGAL